MSDDLAAILQAEIERLKAENAELRRQLAEIRKELYKPEVKSGGKFIE